MTDQLILVCIACIEQLSSSYEDYTKAIPGEHRCPACGRMIQQGPGVVTVPRSKLQLLPEVWSAQMAQDHKDPKNFKPGIYKHYKRAGNYIALQLVSHHDSDELYVVYVCGDTGRVRIREWASPGCDSWTDMLMTDYGMTQRFTYEGPAT